MARSSNYGRGAGRADWERHRFQAVGQAFKPASQDGETAPRINRHLIEGAVRDPVEGDRRRIRLKVNADVLDRELHAGRIDEGQYAAGRAYQRLFEISMGSKALDGTGTRDRASVRDDHIVRQMERAEKSIAELGVISNLIGLSAAMLIRQMLVERNLHTGKAWAFDELARSLAGTATREVVGELTQAFGVALAKMAGKWDLVKID